MKLLHSVAELRHWLAAERGVGRSIALVPTMGNLHEGHLSLVHAAAARADRVVVSVFVNPLQFGPSEDYTRYPRTLDADAQHLAASGVDVLFAPPVEEVYPHGYPPATTVHVRGGLTHDLEGEFRPGHFEGVATVVAILFNLVHPDYAFFGEKDYQQLQVVRRMAGDLGMPVQVVGVPTLRDADGLALSSRNQYLTAEERQPAAALYRALNTVADGLRAGRRDFETLCAEQLPALQALGFRPQYLVVRNSGLGPARAEARRYVVLAAAWLGATRLIDNLQVAL